MKNNTNSSITKTRKLVVVGDGMCGKTCLLYSYIYRTFDATHTPTIFDTYAAEIEVNDKRISLALFDTAGEEDFDRLRPLSYPDTNVVLICFSVNYPSSAANVYDKWNPEIRHFCNGCPVILVACKKDLRTDEETIKKLKEYGEKPVTTEAGKHIAAQIKANAYMECSAKTREGVDELFTHAAGLSLEKRARSNPHRRCFLN